MDDLILSEYNVTCRTADCGNSGITLLVSATATSPWVECGACGERITDVVSITQSSAQ